MPGTLVPGFFVYEKQRIVMDIHFKIIDYDSDEYFEALELRYEILIRAARISGGSNTLRDEIDNVHVAGFLNKILCATVMLVNKGELLKIQRVAVQANLQGQGIGSLMMDYCESYACHNGYAGVYVHARDNAVDFYRKNNYISTGDYFEEDTLPHLKMTKVNANSQD